MRSFTDEGSTPTERLFGDFELLKITNFLIHLEYQRVFDLGAASDTAI